MRLALFVLAICLAGCSRDMPRPSAELVAENETELHESARTPLTVTKISTNTLSYCSLTNTLALMEKLIEVRSALLVSIENLITDEQFNERHRRFGETIESVFSCIGDETQEEKNVMLMEEYLTTKLMLEHLVVGKTRPFETFTERLNEAKRLKFIYYVGHFKALLYRTFETAFLNSNSRCNDAAVMPEEQPKGERR